MFMMEAAVNRKAKNSRKMLRLQRARSSMEASGVIQVM